MPRKMPSREQLMERLRYDPESGKLFWKEKKVVTIYDKGFNTRFAGMEASSREQHRCNILGFNMLTSRIVWKIWYGDDPDHIIHKDGDLSNNRIENLQEVTLSRSQRMTELRENNTSGVRGVMWDKENNMWRATLTVDSSRHNLGRFASIEAAAKAIRVAERKLSLVRRQRNAPDT